MGVTKGPGDPLADQLELFPLHLGSEKESSYREWAAAQTHLGKRPKAILKAMAGSVDAAGTYRSNLLRLSRRLGICKSTLRTHLDGLTEQRLLLIRMEVKPTGAQATSSFRLVRNEQERQQAIAEGFCPERRNIPTAKKRHRPSAQVIPFRRISR